MRGSRGEFKVSVRKEDLVFAAAHFITLPGHRCESLHGTTIARRSNSMASSSPKHGTSTTSWP
ncbi:MAG: hypothetical protein ACREMW_11030 [Gemmatimonadales bacterium]